MKKVILFAPANRMIMHICFISLDIDFQLIQMTSFRIFRMSIIFTLFLLILPDLPLKSFLSIRCFVFDSMSILFASCERWCFLCTSFFRSFDNRGRIGMSIVCRVVSLTQIKFNATSVSASSMLFSKRN